MLCANKITERMLSVPETLVFLICKLSEFTGGVKGLERKHFLRFNWELPLCKDIFITGSSVQTLVYTLPDSVLLDSNRSVA